MMRLRATSLLRKCLEYLEKYCEGLDHDESNEVQEFMEKIDEFLRELEKGKY